MLRSMQLAMQRARVALLLLAAIAGGCTDAPLCSPAGDPMGASLVPERSTFDRDDLTPTPPLHDGDTIQLAPGRQGGAPTVSLNLHLVGFGTSGLTLFASLSIEGKLLGQTLSQRSRIAACEPDGTLRVRDFAIQLVGQEESWLANRPCEIFVQAQDGAGHDARATLHLVIDAGILPDGGQVGLDP
jgi:hypothetical protein